MEAHAPRVRLLPGLAGLLGLVLLLWLAGTLRDILLLVFISGLVAVYLRALTALIEQRTTLPRGPAFTLAVVASVAALVGVGVLLVPPVVAQTRALIAVLPERVLAIEQAIEAFVGRFPELAGSFKPGEHQLLEKGVEEATGWVGSVLPRVFSLAHGVVDLVAVIVMSLYLALDPGLYRGWLVALVPPAKRQTAHEVTDRVIAVLRAWVLAQLLAMTILGVLTAIGLYLLDVPYWLAFGIFTGVVALVPFFGTFVSTLLPALFALGGDGGMTRALAVVALGVIIHVVENNIVNPLIMHRQIALPPVLTIMSVLILSRLLGPLGLLVAVPALAVILVLVKELLLTRTYGDSAMPSAPPG
ncbi:MAG: AI-2E family transporter [Gemmatimonadaceae bacterium]|nr:AI-2E family transporter [Gemmatimonadaceae bacterium]